MAFCYSKEEEVQECCNDYNCEYYAACANNCAIATKDTTVQDIDEVIEESEFDKAGFQVVFEEQDIVDAMEIPEEDCDIDEMEVTDTDDTEVKRFIKKKAGEKELQKKAKDFKKSYEDIEF